MHVFGCVYLFMHLEGSSTPTRPHLLTLRFHHADFWIFQRCLNLLPLCLAYFTCPQLLLMTKFSQRPSWHISTWYVLLMTSLFRLYKSWSLSVNVIVACEKYIGGCQVSHYTPVLQCGQIGGLPSLFVTHSTHSLVPSSMHSCGPPVVHCLSSRNQMKQLKHTPAWV